MKFKRFTELLYSDTSFYVVHNNSKNCTVQYILEKIKDILLGKIERLCHTPKATTFILA